MTDIPKPLPPHNGAEATAAAETDRAMLLEQAIKNLLCVRWTYNRTDMQAAPHVLYRRKNGLYLDAIVMERGGEAPGEIKLGSFKLTGLTNLVIINEAFAPTRTLNLRDIRYEEGIIANAAN